MHNNKQHDISNIARRFRIYGDFVSAEPYGSGHINDTYAVRYDQAGVPVRYIFQRINHLVFKDPPGVMDNIERVTRHTRAKMLASGIDGINRRTLTLVPTDDGASFYPDEEGNYWRCYLFIEKATTYDSIETERHAYEGARAFGLFQKWLLDLPGPPLKETIPGFHDTRRRFSALQDAIQRDSHNRAADVRDEIAFVEEREPTVDVLVELQKQGRVPLRITHNDTKLNNVMIDDETSEGICVIDLDTVMPGLVLYDFGDMVRTSTRPCLEDEQDLSKVVTQMPMFESLAAGYLSVAGDFLNREEKAHLIFSGQLITLEIGIRFLTDYLEGDVYFKTRREGHNRDRCRVQLRMARSLEDHGEQMQNVIERLLNPA